MSNIKNICVITGSRAEYGLIKGEPKGVFKILPDNVLDVYSKLKTSTFEIATIFAIEELKCTNMYLFGKDFYEKDYYINQTGFTKRFKDRKKEHFSKEHVQLCKNRFTKFIEFYPNITFNLYSLANFNPNLENVNIF